MTDRELMQEALYALTYVGDAKEIYSDTIESLRARLAQPEPEPVAWADKYDLDREGHDFWVSRQQPAKNGVPLYTAPPQRDEAPAKAVEWQGLTDEEVEGLWDSSFYDYVGITALRAIVRAIEAKLKENNCVVLSKECYERGCAAYDDRVDEGVMVPKEKNSD
jgi:hypothetical protein